MASDAKVRKQAASFVRSLSESLLQGRKKCSILGCQGSPECICVCVCVRACVRIFNDMFCFIWSPRPDVGLYYEAGLKEGFSECIAAMPEGKLKQELITNVEQYCTSLMT